MVILTELQAGEFWGKSKEVMIFVISGTLEEKYFLILNTSARYIYTKFVFAWEVITNYWNSVVWINCKGRLKMILLEISSGTHTFLSIHFNLLWLSIQRVFVDLSIRSVRFLLGRIPWKNCSGVCGVKERKISDCLTGILAGLWPTKQGRDRDLSCWWGLWNLALCHLIYGRFGGVHCRRIYCGWKK